MSKYLSEIREGLSSKIEMLSHLPPEAKTFGCALTIILGIGGLAIAGVGLGGYLGSFSHLDQVQSLVMMATGTGGGIVFLTVGIVGTVKNCHKKKEAPKETEKVKSPKISEKKIKKIKSQTFPGWLVPDEILSHILSFIDDLKHCRTVCSNWKIQSQKAIDDRKIQFKKAAENGQLKRIEMIKLERFEREIVRSNVSTGQSVTYKEVVNCYAWAGRIIYLGKYKSFQVWELNLKDQWKCIQTINLFVKTLFYKGEKVFSELKDGTIKIWGFDKQKKEIKCIQTLDNTLNRMVKKFTKTADSIYVNESGTVLLRSEKKHIQVWKLLDKWEHIQTLHGHPENVTALDLVGETLFSGNRSRPTIKIWKLSPDKLSIYKDKQWHCKYTIKPRQDMKWPKWKTLLCLHCTEQMIFAGTQTLSIYIWNFDSEKSQWKPIQSINKWPCTSEITSLLFVNEILFRADEEKVHLWKWDKEKTTFEYVQSFQVFSSKKREHNKVMMSLSYNGKLTVATNRSIDFWGA